MNLLAKHHAANPKVGKIVASVGYLLGDGCPTIPAAAALFQAVAEQNPDRIARGQAMMALAWQAGRTFAAAECERSADIDELAAGAEKAFEAVVKDYADCPQLMRDGLPTLGEEAKQELYGLRNLRVGKVAPEIEGEDLNGTKFRLSDSRGKVTVVLFWASWCGPCMAMMPQVRNLVERMKKRPFALIGVNGDDNSGKAKQAAAKEQLTWRSFWNGSGGPNGPITRAWNVRSWPRVYVLDPTGVIRFKHRLLLQSNELDQAVDLLLRELGSRKPGA
jgi:thiol-disulfide isomerase/thioredoxin